MISSNRIILKPLSPTQLEKYVRDDGSLEADLRLNAPAERISTSHRQAVADSILPEITDVGKHHLFSTLWVIILKAETRIIGTISFLGKPEGRGQIEIGYQTVASYRHRGYMSEAIGLLLRWIFVNETIKSVEAITAQNNTASTSVLKKNGFKRIGKKEDELHWQLVLKK